MFFPWKLNGWPICEDVPEEASGSGSGSGSSSASNSASSSASNSASASASSSASTSSSASSSASGSASGSTSASASASSSASTSSSASSSASGSASGSTSASASASSSASTSSSASSSASDSTSGSTSGSNSGSSSGGGGGDESSSSGSNPDDYYAVIAICLKRADGICSSQRPSVYHVNSNGIQFSLATGIFPGDEYTDINGDVYTFVRIGEKYKTRFEAETYYGTKTTTEWDAIGLQLCCGVKCTIKLDVHQGFIGDYFPYSAKWEEEEFCWTDPATGEEYCDIMPGEYIGEAQSWSVNDGETQWCMMGTWEELEATDGWKSAGSACIGAVNASWKALDNSVSSWPLRKTESRKIQKDAAGTLSYYSYYGDYDNYHHWRNKKFGRLYVEAPTDLPPNSKTGVVLKVTIRVRMYDFTNTVWGEWTYLTQDEEVELTWGWKIPLPIVDNVPDFYDCGGEDMYHVCPNDGWEFWCAECEIDYTLLRYI